MVRDQADLKDTEIMRRYLVNLYVHERICLQQICIPPLPLQTENHYQNRISLELFHQLFQFSSTYRNCSVLKRILNILILYIFAWMEFNSSIVCIFFTATRCTNRGQIFCFVSSFYLINMTDYYELVQYSRVFLGVMVVLLVGK